LISVLSITFGVISNIEKI